MEIILCHPLESWREGGGVMRGMGGDIGGHEGKGH